MLLLPVVGQAPAPPSFDRDVRPILAAHCLRCHGQDAAHRRGELRLDQRAEATARGAWTPGVPDASEAIRRVGLPDTDADRMPPRSAGRGLDANERDVLRRWVAAGATYEPHWAFSPPVRPPLPACAGDAFVRNPIDAFVLAAMRARGLEPSPEAPRALLFRRLSLDLTGLPPGPAATRAFLADDSVDAYARAVDGLLAAPHFGEHMAAPWLDAARYADSNGYQHDGDRQAWPWRDWLVRSFNANRRLDDMVVEMLAGDLLPHRSRDQVVATAFLRHHLVNNEGGAIADEVRFGYVVDRVNTVATVFLGLTLGCAQCHDHKYDPFTQREYYSLFAFFDNVDEDGTVDLSRRNSYHEFQYAAPHLDLADAEQARALSAARQDLDAARAAWNPIEKALAAGLSAWLQSVSDDALTRLPPTIATAVRKQRTTPLTGAEYRRLRTHYATVASGNPEWARLQTDLDRREADLGALHERVPVVMVMRERAERRPTRLHVRGAYDQPAGDVLEPAVPEVLGSLPVGATKDRLALARWLVSPRNPLFARVLVNRVWQQVFGRGLVTTPEDFGTTGARPSHPELLDWLACELVASGFDLQHLLRLIVESGTYRQSANVPPAQAAVDPDATWLARSPRRRLSSFVLRDQALALSELLDRRVGGPPVFPDQPEGLWLDVSFDTFGYPHGRPGEQHRRSVYTFWRRTVAPPDLFDAANRQTCVVRPACTNTPLHALVLLNDPVYVDSARGLAAAVLRTPGSDGERAAAMFARATGRTPSDRELAVLTGAVERERLRYERDPAAARALAAAGAEHLATGGACEVAAWTALGQLVLNLDEVLCRP